MVSASLKKSIFAYQKFALVRDYEFPPNKGCIFRQLGKIQLEQEMNA